MFKRLSVLFISFMPLQAIAWEDARVLAFIANTNPVIRSQQQVSDVFAVPSALDYVLENTTFSGKAGFGGTDFIETPYTVYGGLQFNIPLSSRKEEREQALKQVAEKKEIDSINTSVMTDMAKLRLLESELEASKVRRAFFQKKAKWIKERIDQGYASDMDKLWTLAEKINTEDALVAKNTLQSETQRHRLARYAGEQWQTLLAYLNGDESVLGDFDG
ncbi:MAG: hypothetical protein IBX55_21435 [Methyloprofundus sp.]|nr:hypothetical protein [Methyloprofundus sp.]MDF1583611.1 hypothetical protein [Methyloprofundus sp.]